MSQQDYVYGVFNDYERAAAAISSLHEAGFGSDDICLVGKACEQYRHLSARINDPAKKAFMAFGAAGALGGLFAGVMLAPTLPYVVTFQLLTTLMASLSCAIVFAYFGAQLSVFLRADQPKHYANAYEGEIADGVAIVSIETNSHNKRNSAMEVLEQGGAYELILRGGQAGPLVSADLVLSPESVETQPAKPMALTAAA